METVKAGLTFVRCRSIVYGQTPWEDDETDEAEGGGVV
jgi:hypothetical protein